MSTWDLAGARYWRPPARPEPGRPVAFEELYCLTDGTWLRHAWHATPEPDIWEVLPPRQAFIWFGDHGMGIPYDLSDWMLEHDPIMRMIRYGAWGVTEPDLLRWITEMLGDPVPPELMAITKPLGRIMVQANEEFGLPVSDRVRELAARQEAAEEATTPTRPPPSNVIPFRPRALLFPPQL